MGKVEVSWTMLEPKEIPMKCPVCENELSDQQAQNRPCPKCECMDLMTDKARKEWRIIKDWMASAITQKGQAK
jgi:Zn finger protein HypA/HybF involved in hydrogenase expression